MRKIILSILVLVAACTSAQVTTNPAIIPVDYTGQVTITFDPSLGDKGMVSATECYLYSCVEVDNSGKWEYQLAPWPSNSAKTRMTKSGNKWEITIPDLYTFYGVPSGKQITKILVLFTDGKNNGKSGRGPGGNDIVIVLGEEMAKDIWEGFTPAAVTTQPRPTGISNGIYYDPNDPTKVTLCTYAASKTQPANHVFVVGDMTDWKLDNAYQMKREGNYFWITLTGLTPGQEYRFQYAVERADGVRKQISDLYSEKVISRNDQIARKVDPSLIAYPLKGADGGYVTVIQPGKPAFQWSSATLNFQRPNKNNLIIYEIWPYDHTAERTIEGLINRLDYIENLGVNAVELMPMCEFEYPDGWGYGPTHYFAMQKACGTPEQLKTFIDECHKRGIAVILDMVFNHATGLNPMNKLYPKTGASGEPEFAQNPWFNVNPPHGDNVFEDWNHDFAPAHEMFTRAFQYWLTEYKVDGFRLDLSHGLCGPTDNAVDNLKDYYTNAVQATSPDAYLILEHWGKKADGTVDQSQQQDLSDCGMLPWNKMNFNFGEIAMGYTSASSSLINANKDGFVSYSESHDEERNFFKAVLWGAAPIPTNETERVKRAPLVLGLLTMLNGPKMFYHFEELAFDYSKFQTKDGLWGSDNEDDYKGGSGYGKTPDLNENVKMYPKYRPEGWMKGGERMNAYQKIGQIIQLRTRLLPTVFEGDPTAVSVSSGSLRTIQWGSDVFVAGNVLPATTVNVTLPSGTWYDYLGGGTTATSSYTLQPGEIKVFTGSKITLPVVPTSYNFPEGMEEIAGSAKSSQAQKILRDGQIFILVGDRVYNIQGQRVQ